MAYQKPKKHSKATLSKPAELVYTNPDDPGIRRIRNGNGFSFYSGKTKVKDVATLNRIQSLRIPPSWKHVWINSNSKGHLQATGFDLRHRKQYRYHAFWDSFRSQAKFSTLLEFGKALPKIRKAIKQHLRLNRINEKHVLALVIRLLEETFMRVGNEYYERVNGSHGITTLKDNHVKINGHTVVFSFKGKKGIQHNIALKNNQLARLVKKCRDIPGTELFQYFDTTGERKKIDSGMVNNYIREISGKQFTAKDFRTWAGSVNALEKVKELKKEGVHIYSTKSLNDIADYVSEKLGNTRAICKKYYIHPTILELAANDRLPVPKNNGGNTILTSTEKWLIDILKSAKTKSNPKSLGRKILN